jgi:hypothetical protein
MFGLPEYMNLVKQMNKLKGGHPYPVCGTKIQKIQYVGGACYFCSQSHK